MVWKKKELLHIIFKNILFKMFIPCGHTCRVMSGKTCHLLKNLFPFPLLGLQNQIFNMLLFTMQTQFENHFYYYFVHVSLRSFLTLLKIFLLSKYFFIRAVILIQLSYQYISNNRQFLIKNIFYPSRNNNSAFLPVYIE